MRTLLAIVAAAVLSVPTTAQSGLTLFQPFFSSTTYLIDGNGVVRNSWTGTVNAGLSMYLLPDGDLMRTRNLVNGGPGSGGGVERLSYSGQIEWRVSFFSPSLTPHHDMAVLPNGNVLLIVWEELGSAAAIAQGRDPATAGNSFTPDGIYEITQTGPTTGAVVWEWHAFDHLVQDFDANLPNFGVVADSPQLIDINYGPSGDWMHGNGIDYNAELDQIVLSVLTFNEVWVIDHSTTTAEAAGHSGGNSGRGGDILYRYGNPQTYDRGTAADQLLYGTHDVQWIEEGRPGAGNLIAFNNGTGRPTGNWSSVEEWTPPVDAQGSYTIAPGAAFGPSAPTWSYSDQGNFYSQIMSGVQRLENGNTLICEATSGRLFEVDSAGNLAWNYVNPFGGNVWVFKARRYSDCDANGVFDGHDIASGSGADGNSNGVLDVCEMPTNYCQAAANSSGSPAVISAVGSRVVAANNLALTTTDMPANAFAFYLVSDTQDFITNAGGSQGNLCLGGAIGRYVGPGQVLDSGAMGVVTLALDLTMIPRPTGFVSVMAGDTWNWTTWFRDSVGGAATSNFSNGIEIVFL